MKKSRIFQTLGSLSIAAFFIGGQQAVAQENHHTHVKLMLRQNAASRMVPSATTPAPDLYPLQAGFTQTYPTISANSDGSDLWPCSANASVNSSSPSPDCPVLGSPSIPFPNGAVVIGHPQYVWSLENNSGYGFDNDSGNGYGCDALVNGTSGWAQYNACGQVETWYEDDTGDTTDDLLQRTVVTQGTRIIADSGVVDFGPSGPTVTYPVSFIIYSDQNFGFWPGAGVGPNNGNCSADSSYPLTSAANPGGLYVVEAGTTCQEPVPGLATVTMWTRLATPAYKEVAGAACTSKGVTSPCYTVEWTNKYEARNEFSIFLE